LPSLRYDLRLDGVALLRLALVSYLRGSYALSITQFSEYLQQHPDSATAHLNLGRFHLRQSSLRDALDCFRKAGGVESDEHRWLAHIVKGDERRRAGDCEDFSIWVWVQLIRQGIPCRMVLGGLFSDELNHSWVQIYRCGSVGIVDFTPSGYNLVIGSRHATEYRPMHSLDKTLRWYSHV
jgi:tetratricopeptide (TPR) repeat protein